jgi:citrate lyase gamma subunit
MDTSTAPLDLVPLDSETRKIAQQILDEHDVDRVKDLTNLFNLNAQKRNVMRVMKMNELLDKVTDQVMERFEKTPANFSNDDLIKFMQVTETSIERANKSLNLVEQTPAIQYQQNNQVNINIGSELDRESRQRVTDTVQAILARMRTQPAIVESNDEGDSTTDAG